MILVDTSVLLDLAREGSPHAAWSAERLVEAIRRGDPRFVNDVIYAELSVGFPDRLLVDDSLAMIGAERLPMSADALFAAGKAFARYRHRPGPREERKASILPDFFIGAHAAPRDCAC